MRPAVRRLRPHTIRPANVGPPAAVRIRLRQPVADPTPAGPHARDPKLARLEACLLLADEPLPVRKLTEAAGLHDAAETRRLVDRLKACYDADGTAFQVAERAGGYQLLTRSEYHPWLVRLRRAGHEVRLTSAALETLAVVAYKQPITRAEVEKIRGVACAELIRLLMEKGLVRVTGRDDSLGRPQLYGTTKRFLQVFGLNTLHDLPAADGLPPPG